MPDRAPKTVLVVDDSRDNRETVCELLRSEGFDVAEATTGREAVAHLESDRPVDVILLDLIMPEMSGWDFLAWRRSHPRTAAVPVVVLSGASKAEDTVGLIAGASSVDVLGKPVDCERLLELIRRSLSSPPSHDAPVMSQRAIDFTGVMRLLIEAVKDYAVYLLDPPGHVTTWNAGAQRLTGYEAHEVIGQHVSVFSPDRACDGSLEAAARDDRFAGEVWRVRKDGSRFWAHVVITALRDANRDLIGFGVVTGDVTDRRKAEEDLNQLFELSRDMLCTAGFDGFFKRVNSAWTKALGYSREELLQQPYLELVHPDDRERTVTAARGLNDGLSAVSFENRYRREDGTYRWLQWNATPLLEQKTIFCVARDVTDRKRLEEQLRQTQKMEAIGRLAGGVAHDFNNLLTAISGYTDLALEKLHARDPVRPFVEQTKKAGVRATALTQQLLAFSSKQVLQPKVVNVNSVVTGMHELLRRLIPENVNMAMSLAPAAGNVDVDPGQLEQVIMNLAINARDAMPRGGKLTIETKTVFLDAEYGAAHAEVAPGPYVMFAVTDTGVGMDKDVMNHLFEPFFSTKGEQGIGLGLATVYGIVKQSGGHVWVYSEVDRGTTFKVYLPRVEEAALSIEPAAPSRPTRGSETVLLVEDEETVRDLVREVLTARGYEVLEASNGNDALRLVDRRDGPIHLMVSDVVMPHMSGRDLADRLLARRPDTRVLFMSGYTDTAIVENGVLEPGTAFIQKPFSPGALTAKVREVLDGPPGGTA